MSEKMWGLLAAALLLAACGDSDRTLSAPAETTPDGSAPTVTSTTAEPTMTTVPLTTTTRLVTTTTAEPTTTVPEITEPASYTPAEFDPPLGELTADLLVFDDHGAYWLIDGKFTKIIEGPFEEVIDDGAGGILFQREQWDARVIWWLPAGADAPQELLVAEEPSALILEGIMGDGGEREVVYQRLDPGSPQDDRKTLRTYRLVDGVIQEVAETGWWEGSTIISSIVDGVAVGATTMEGVDSYYWFDIARQRSLISAFASELGQWGDAMTLDDGQILSVGWMSNTGGLVTQMGLFRVDQDSNRSDPIATFLWDNGYWYPSGLLVINDFAVISRGGFEDRSATAMGPIVVDLASGESFTLPYAFNARPLRR